MTNEQFSIDDLKSKIQYGDYATLSKMLNTNTVDAAKQRFFRGNQEAIDAMAEIIANREQLIESFKSKKDTSKNN